MFNLRNDSFIVLNSELGTFVDSIRGNIDILCDKHPNLYTQMVEKQFIVNPDTDEAMQIVERWKLADADISRFSIIINPTLGCNLRCWYCYENHEHKPIMKKNARRTILNLLHILQQMVCC